VFHGYLSGRQRILVPSMVAGSKEVGLLSLKSIGFDLPVLEYRPFRSFSMDQTSTLLFQLYGEFEMPGSAEVVSPTGFPVPELRTIYDFGVRLAFDWRRY
jgi:hypothetical protein